MRWLIAFLQMLGPILGGWHFLRSVYQPWKAYQGSDVSRSWEGYYGPLVGNLLMCLIGVSLTFAAPRWRTILVWIRERLPSGEEDQQLARLLQLIRIAFREKRENGVIEARNLMAQLNGASEREYSSSAAMESLRVELQRILTELQGGATG